MGSLKLGIYCSVSGMTGWFFMHYKGGWYFFPDKNCGNKRAVKDRLGTDNTSIAQWSGFTAEDKQVTNIMAIVNLSTHQVLVNKEVF